MKTLEKGQDRINKICSLLREETIEPAKKEAQNIIADAQQQAEKIIQVAQKQAENLIFEARSLMEQERTVFNSSLEQATKQGLEALRQSIEHKLFNQQLESLLEKQMADPKVIANLIHAIVKSLDKEGLALDLIAMIPKDVTPGEVNKLIAEEILKKLSEHSVQVGDFKGGAQVKLSKKKVTIDITQESLQELLANYIRKDFRKLLFAS